MLIAAINKLCLISPAVLMSDSLSIAIVVENRFGGNTITAHYYWDI